MSFPWQPVAISEFLALVGGALAWITTRSDLAGQLAESAVERGEMNQDLLDLQRRARECDSEVSALIKSHRADMDRQREDHLTENSRLSGIIQRMGSDLAATEMRLSAAVKAEMIMREQWYSPESVEKMNSNNSEQTAALFAKDRDELKAVNDRLNTVIAKLKKKGKKS